MEIDKTKQQKKLERYFVAPNWTPVLGLTVTKDTDVEDETERKGENGILKIKDKIKDLKLIIEEEMETVLEGGEKVKSKAIREIEVREGTRLIWLEGKGYIIPDQRFQTIKEIREDLENLKDLDL